MRLRFTEAGKQILKTLTTVGAEEKMSCACHGFSSKLFDFSFQNMRQGLTMTILTFTWKKYVTNGKLTCIMWRNSQKASGI